MLLPAPPNAPAEIRIDRRRQAIEIRYGNLDRFVGRYRRCSDLAVISDRQADRFPVHLTASGRGAVIEGTFYTSDQAFATDTNRTHLERFRVVRNSDGPSYSLLNTAVYDRGQDFLLEGLSGTTTIEPLAPGKFKVVIRGPQIGIQVTPHYYQAFKNIRFFEPWKHPLTHESKAGWCSWWAYRDGIDEQSTLAAAAAFAKNLKDFGFDTIQLDDGYESAKGAPPDFWLKTNDKFPHGLGYLAKSIAGMGLKPGIWVGTQIFDEPITEAHPDWFARDADGKAHKGPWIGYGVDGSNPAALDALFRPVFKAFHDDGFQYVKVDSLRHLLYDAYYPCRAQLAAEGTTPELAFRKYLSVARQELGSKTYLLACWGVLPEAAGIADACRLGTDGFGPSTLLQYNSWNNVVWRNDPDHVDINGEGEDIIRPTLVSMAGAQLLLSDKAEFYRNTDRLEGARRAAPIPFTLPGQLYDIDPTKTANLIDGLRNQNGGSQPGPIDADQRGPECQWWQLDVSRPFERWTVLARLAWRDLPEARVRFSDLGLPNRRYAVYEFWSHRYLGEFSGGFAAPAQAAKQPSVYAIRPVLDRPQIISTSRHITQGGPDLVKVAWDPDQLILSGVSRVVANDPYKIAVRDAGYEVVDHHDQVNGLSVITLSPPRTGTEAWSIQFRRKS